MFGDLNIVQIIGNITQDLEVRQTSSGNSVCGFRVATNRRYQSQGEWKEETEFHNVVVWGAQAESLASRARKGTRLYIQGHLATRTWDDDSGVKHYKTEIVSNKLILLDRFEKNIGQSQSAPTTTETPKKASKKNVKDDGKTVDPNDLPF